MGKGPLLTPPASASLTCLAWSTRPLLGQHHMSLPLSPGPILSACSARLLVQSKADLSQPCHLIWNKDAVNGLKTNHYLSKSKHFRADGSSNSKQAAHVTHLLFFIERPRSLVSLSASPQSLSQFLLGFVRCPG